MAGAFVDWLEEHYAPALTTALAGATASLKELALKRYDEHAYVPQVDVATVTDTLVAAGVRIRNPTLITAADWMHAVGGDAVRDALGDAIVHAATQAAMLQRALVSDEAVVEVLNHQMVAIEAWGPEVATSFRQRMELEAANGTSLAGVRRALAADDLFSKDRAQG